MTETKHITAVDFPVYVDQDLHLVKQRMNDWLLLARDSVPEHTFRTYASDWHHFWDWCQFGETVDGRRVPYHQMSISASTIIDYIKAYVGLAAPATIRHRLSTINKILGVAGLPSPYNDELVKQAKRLIGQGYNKKPSRPGTPKTFYEEKLEQLARMGKSKADLHRNLAGEQRQAKGLKFEHLFQIRHALSLEGFNWQQRKHARARALIHLAHDSMCRVSEIVKINIEDIEWRDKGNALLKIGQRKESQEGETKYAFISQKTAEEVQTWLKLADINSGPLFCSFTRNGRKLQFDDDGVQRRMVERNVLDIYKFVAQKIGVDAAAFSCHSTRVGAAQDLLENNISTLKVMQSGRWKTETMPNRYGEKSDTEKGGMAQFYSQKEH